MNGLELSFNDLAGVFGGLTTFTMCLLPLLLCFFKGVRKLSQISLIQERHLPRHLHLSKAITLHSYSYYVVDSGTS